MRRNSLRRRLREALINFIDPDRYYDMDKSARDWARRCGDNAGKLEYANMRIKHLEDRLENPSDAEIQRLVERFCGKEAVDA